MTGITIFVISIHALREESDDTVTGSVENTVTISIHALREESDFFGIRKAVSFFLFQSTLSVRRATISFMDLFKFLYISIHALREESDEFLCWKCESCWNISIHALREESDNFFIVGLYNQLNFNPRSP